jgi:uncharacterized protein (TIGR03437 family)
VVNGASFEAGIAPGSWVTIQGTNLARTNPGRTWRSDEIVNGNLPTVLDGVSVTINGKPAYVYYISPTQVNVQAPSDTTQGPVNIIVTNNGISSAPATAQLQTLSPAFFLYGGGSYAIATRYPDNARVGNPNKIPDTVAAQPGDVLILWGTGFGPTDPTTPAGVVVNSAATAQTLPAVTVGGVAVNVIGTALSPGSAGLYQVAIQLPASLPAGDVTVQASSGGLQSPSNVKINVRAMPSPGSLSGIQFSTYSNQSDPLALTAQDSGGNLISYFADKDANGTVTSISALQITDNKNEITRFFLDPEERPIRITTPRGVIYKFAWQTASTVVVTAITPDGSFNVSTRVNVDASIKALFRPALSPVQTAGTRSLITVTQCGKPGSDATVIMNVVPAVGFAFDLPATPTQSPGVYSVSVPVPDPNAATQAVSRCASLLGNNTLVDKLCSSQSKELFTPVCAGVATALAAIPGGFIAGATILEECPVIAGSAILACNAVSVGNKSGLVDRPRQRPAHHFASGASQTE